MAALSKQLHNKEQLLFLIVENLKSNINLLSTDKILWDNCKTSFLKEGFPMPLKG
jgi:hypothetical protein